MKKRTSIILIITIALVLLVGCTEKKEESKVVDYNKAKELIEKQHVTLIDVRDDWEYVDGHIEGAINIPLKEISKIEDTIESKKEYIIVYCKSGMRSSNALIELEKMGYTNVYDLGSIDNWVNE